MTTELKNMYEGIIQDMIVDGINGMTPELKAMIDDAPIDKRRVMILNLLEENNPEHRLMCSKIQKTISSGNATESKHIKDVVKMLREYVEVSDVEVKTMGEVMTPISLVEEMLDTLPYEVWTNPELKWLDPCNGVGTFLSVVVQRLMKGLEGFQPDDKLRYEHIMENMIYACELQSKNVFLYLYAFDPKDEYALNVYNGSYLDEGFDRHMDFWGVEKFDVIVMNPPYQELKEGNRKSKAIWNEFVIKTVDQLVEGGYLVAVHPSAWRGIGKKTEEVRKQLLSKQLTYLELHSVEDGLKVFGAQTRYDFYCLHNVPNTMFTKIKDYEGNISRIDLSEVSFIPNKNIEFIYSLVAKNGEEKVNILNDSSYHLGNLPQQMSKEQTEEFKYPCIYHINKNAELNFRWSNVNNKGHFGQPKFIFPNGDIRSINYIIDNDGKYGMTEWVTGIIDESKNYEFIYKAFRSDLFKEVVEACSLSQTAINKNVIALFRKDFWKEFLY